MKTEQHEIGSCTVGSHDETKNEGRPGDEPVSHMYHHAGANCTDGHGTECGGYYAVRGEGCDGIEREIWVMYCSEPRAMRQSNVLRSVSRPRRG